MVASAFRVSHFAEDTSARGGDAFDGVERAVWIIANIHGWITVEVGVLGGNLTVCGEFFVVVKAEMFLLGIWSLKLRV